MILLIGIVKKNAILMIDFAIEAKRTQNLSSYDAIFQACLLRFRPIMMTTTAAILGAMPLAVSFGNGGEIRRPLGISIVGGLLDQPTADALHHAGGLSVSGSARPMVAAHAAAGCLPGLFGAPPMTPAE